MIRYILLLNLTEDLEPDQFLSILETYPDLKEYKLVKKLAEFSNKQIATSVGNKYADFEISYEGVSHKLSDVVDN